MPLRGHARGELSVDRCPKITEPRCPCPGRAALGERAVPIAVEPLVKRLKDGDLAVRLQAVIALGRIGHAEAIPDLLPLLSETDAFLAFSARQALRRIGDWSAAAQGLDSPDPKVRAGTLLAMEQVYDERGLPAGWRNSPCRPNGHRGAGEGNRVSGGSRSQGAAVGRQVVGHAAGEAKTASQDDRLGRHAARHGDASRAVKG